ncbi:MAG TPA: DeoR family transcriptional regulator [Caldilineae bacterium]|nr:DeoR family transcriptional regulator [Caldilineae bacterium]
MLASERRQIILEHLENSGRVRVSELTEILDVSRMTIHRDLSQLADEGHLEKVFGGAVARQSSDKDGCAMCGMAPRERTAFVLQCADGSQLQACCPHCGIMLLSARPQVVSALAADYLHGRMVNVRTATFLVDPDLTVCCTPTVLCFQDRDEAEKFQRGFGGKVMDLVNTQSYLRASMTL